jgi:hypothetical protein
MNGFGIRLLALPLFQDPCLVQRRVNTDKIEKNGDKTEVLKRLRTYRKVKI